MYEKSKPFWVTLWLHFHTQQGIVLFRFQSTYFDNENVQIKVKDISRVASKQKNLFNAVFEKLRVKFKYMRVFIWDLHSMKKSRGKSQRNMHFPHINWRNADDFMSNLPKVDLILLFKWITGRKWKVANRAHNIQ